MTPEQVVALLAVIADLKLAVSRLEAENAQLRQALADMQKPQGETLP